MSEKKERTLRVFKNLNEFNEYRENHHMGDWWSYDSDDFNSEYNEEYEDYVAICCYEYETPKGE